MNEQEDTGYEALEELLLMPMNIRRDAVAKDVRSRKPKYRDIDAHDLAEALGAPDPFRPGQGWRFTRYTKRVTVESYANECSPASEVLDMLENFADPERYKELLKYSDRVDRAFRPRFSFLTPAERRHIEDEISERQHDADESNGMHCIAHFTVSSPSGEKLEFEAEIEDDGECVILRTPYDKRAKKFVDLSNCFKTEW